MLSFVAVSSARPGRRPESRVLIGAAAAHRNFASLGQQYLWAGQTVEDIVNNDYPDLQVPLGPGKGFPAWAGPR